MVHLMNGLVLGNIEPDTMVLVIKYGGFLLEKNMHLDLTNPMNYYYWFLMIKLLSSKSPTGWFLPSSQPSGVEHKHIFEATNQTMRAFSEAKNGNLKTSKNGGLISKQSDLTSNTRDHFQHECSDCSGNKPRLFLMVFLTYRWLGGLYSALDTAVVNLTTARRNILKTGDPAWKREFNGENDHQPVDLGEFRVCVDYKQLACGVVYTT